MNEREVELKKHKFIVFCSDHYNPLGLVRSLGEKGIKPIVVLNVERVRPYLIIKSKYPSVIHEVQSAKEGLDFIIKNYGNEQDCKPFIYSCSDDICQLLDQNYEFLKDSFFFFHGKNQGIVTKYLDKSQINELAIKKGCSVLNNEILKRGELPQKLRYPVITKAMASTLYAWKDEMNICKNEEELLQAYNGIRSEEILVQEYIYKKNELCVDGFSFNGGEEVYIPYYSNYLRFSDISYGGYIVLKPFEKCVEYKQLKAILKEVGFTGIFSAEFLVDKDNNNWFLEVNFRNSTWSYAYTYGGVNMPYLWAEGELFGNLQNNNFKLLDEYKAISECEDFMMAVQNGELSYWQWLKQFKDAEVHFLYNSKDRKPFSVYIFLLKRIIKKFLHLE